MHRVLFALAALALAGLGHAAPAAAQGYTGFEVCAGDDPKCQIPGSVGLLCISGDASLADPTNWKPGADAMRVNNGRWEIWGAGGDPSACPLALVYHGFQTQQGWGGLRYCAGDDPSCQASGLVAYACFFSQEAVSQPSEWHYTGDSIQVASGRWEVFYAFNRQRYACASVLVGPVPYGGFGQLRVCDGADTSCQGTNVLPVMCDRNGGSFGTPTQSDYTGRAMRVSGGQWQFQYPDASIHNCARVIVAVAGGSRPGGIQNPPSPPQSPPAGQPAAEAVPSGAVIYFAGTSCPSGWTRLQVINQPNTVFHGMSVCRKQ